MLRAYTIAQVVSMKIADGTYAGGMRKLINRGEIAWKSSNSGGGQQMDG